MTHEQWNWVFLALGCGLMVLLFVLFPAVQNILLRFAKKPTTTTDVAGKPVTAGKPFSEEAEEWAKKLFGGGLIPTATAASIVPPDPITQEYQEKAAAIRDSKQKEQEEMLAAFRRDVVASIKAWGAK